MSCIGQADRALFKAGLLGETRARLAREHLRDCADCRSLFSDESAPTLERVDEPAAVGAAAGPALGRGFSFGRYLVLGFLGAGGMGEVYSAYDPELDRKTAIKVVSARAGSEDQRARMFREAQAMARLSHPHVVAVYDVGVSESRVFIVMEFVQGRTLRVWGKEAERSWREILSVYLAAGRGLAAAHAVGLVHRDFKPDNVLVGQNGAVKVTDFGIARLFDDELARSPAGGLDVSGALPLLTTPITRQGALIGTPGYMAPEQLHALESTGRTDQFSFCAALFEALYGTLPFEGATCAELYASIEAGRVVAPPGDSAVPSAVHRAILRGLAFDPAARHPSMDALLVSLAGRDSPGRALRAGALGLAALTLALGAVVARASRPSAPSCDSGPARLEEAWGGATREAMARRFLAVDRSYAPEVLRHTVEVLDAYGARWLAMHKQTCEATRVSGEQSEQLMTLRMACLEERHQELRALTGLFAEADASVVEKAVHAASSLAPVEECARATSLLAVQPLPSAPAARAEIGSIRLALASVKARANVRRPELVRDEAQALVERAVGVGYLPIEAEALFALGSIHARASDDRAAVDALQRAVYAAEAGSARETKVEAELDLALVLPDLSRFDEAASWAEMAHAAASTLGGGPWYEVRYHDYLGRIFFRQGKYAESVQQSDEAIALAGRTGDRSAEELAKVFLNASSPLSKLGRGEEALARIARAEALLRDAVGERHPARIRAVVYRAIVQDEQGRFAESLASDDEGLRLAEGVFAPTHQTVVALHNNRGEALRWLGRYDEALVAYRRAEALLPPDAKTSMFAGAHAANIGLTLVALGRPHEAEAASREALGMLEKALPAEHEWVGNALVGLGLSRLALADAGAAVPMLERALAIYLHAGTLNVERQIRVADVQLALAQARRLRGDMGPDVRALAVAARAAYVAAGRTSGVRAADAWLGSVPRPLAVTALE